MTSRAIDLTVGMGLLLGPLAYALLLEGETVVVTEYVPQPVVVQPSECAPPPPAAVEPTPVVEEEPEPVVEPDPDPEPEPEPSDRIAFAFVNEAGIVLSTEAPASWGTGRLRKHAGPGQFRAAKRANSKQVPQSLWTQRGRTFDLYGAAGKVCTVRVGALSVIAQHEGPSLYDLFVPDGEWLEEADPADVDRVPYEQFDESSKTPRDIRRKVWSYLGKDESAWLVAEPLDDDSCKGAVWARDAQLPAPAVLHPSDEPSASSQQFIDRFSASDELAELRASHEEWKSESGNEVMADYDDWEAIATRSPATVRSWLDVDDTPQRMELNFGEPGEGCGDGFYSEIERVDAMVDGEWTSTDSSTGALAIFDADLDGKWETLHGNDDGTPMWLTSPTLEQSWSLPEQFYCPC
ncbi:MAG: hypothetical protein K0V04_18205 [Deltaproteobacteria bacterium]|nr:hypothetical protein [Deltaproteobacteria bacterium]